MATASRTVKKSTAQPSEESRMQKIADNIQSTAEKLRDQVKKNFHDSSVAAKVRSLDASIAVIKLQHSVFDRSFKMLARIEKYGDNLVKRHVQGAKWLPKEGKDIVREWKDMLNDERLEFQKTVDKSYDLMKDYLERIRKAQVSTGKKKAVMKTATPLKPKSVTKKKTRVSASRAHAPASAM